MSDRVSLSDDVTKRENARVPAVPAVPAGPAGPTGPAGPAGPGIPSPGDKLSNLFSKFLILCSSGSIKSLNVSVIIFCILLILSLDCSGVEQQSDALHFLLIHTVSDSSGMPLHHRYLQRIHRFGSGSGPGVK